MELNKSVSIVPSFIREAIAEDLKNGRFNYVRTRLPPEPNGYLHIGHCKAFLIDYYAAMENGGELKVVIRAAKTPAEARIDISDTGPGIAPEHINQVFDPFFTTKKVGVGTGLGLSVSYNIIKKNGGRMEVNSRPGQGACFSIFLPLAGHMIAEG